VCPAACRQAHVKSLEYISSSLQPHGEMCRLVSQETNFKDFCYAHTQNYTHTEGYQGSPRSLPWCTHKTVREYYYSGTTTLGHLNLAVRRNSSSPGHGLYVNLAVRRDYSSPAAGTLRQPRCAPRLPVSGRTRSTSTLSCAATTRHPATRALRQPHRAPRVLIPTLPPAAIYFDYAAPPDASARRAAHHATCRAVRRRLLRLAQARRRLLRLHRASGCLGT
jgi:hypothetical protein